MSSKAEIECAILDIQARTSGARRASRNRFRDAYETSRVFTLRLPARVRGEACIMIEARDSKDPFRCGPHHTPLDVIVRQGGKLIRETCIGLPGHHTTDGAYARHLACGAAVYLSDEDDNPAELVAWAEANYDHVTMVAFDRYGEF